jgi:hypothetical protein
MCSFNNNNNKSNRVFLFIGGKRCANEKQPIWPRVKEGIFKYTNYDFNSVLMDDNLLIMITMKKEWVFFFTLTNIWNILRQNQSDGKVFNCRPCFMYASFNNDQNNQFSSDIIMTLRQWRC